MKKFSILIILLCFLIFNGCTNGNIVENNSNNEDTQVDSDTKNNDDRPGQNDQADNNEGKNINDNSYLSYQSETIGNEDIEYKNYYTVVIEDYDGIHKDKLAEIDFINPLYTGEQMVQYKVAVFGPVENVKLTRENAISKEKDVVDISDSISDSIIKISTRMFSDTSYDSLTFTGPDGNEHEIIIDDMSGIIDIIAIDETGEKKITIQ